MSLFNQFEIDHEFSLLISDSFFKLYLVYAFTFHFIITFILTG